MAAFRAPVRFFLGTNTPTGFVGTTQELYDPRNGWRVYILKSGAGTGKSTLLRRIYESVTATGEEGEVFCCSSDPESLDAVRFPDRKLCVVDGTAPHSMEPAYWGAVEQIVPLFLCMNSNHLRERTAEIIALTDENRMLHRRCRKYLHAAASLCADSRRIEGETLNREKVRRLAHRLAVTEWGKNTPAAQGISQRRFLSALTPEGLLTFYDTLQALCPRIYAIEDEQGAAAALLLSELQNEAVSSGQTCIACPCPLFPEEGPEHLLLPELGLGFTASNSFHKVDFPVFRRIHASRFLDIEQLRRRRQLLSFNRRAATELLSEAAALSAQAKAVHDRMEQYNAAAMDWNRCEQLTTELLANL